MKRSPLKRKTPMKRSGPLKRSGPIKPKRRKASEARRIYGDDARQAWMRAMPCFTCGRHGPIELSHTRTGGTSYKADASTLIPQCHACHEALHRMGMDSFCESHGITRSDLYDRAEELDRAWNAQQA